MTETDEHLEELLVDDPYRTHRSVVWKHKWGIVDLTEVVAVWAYKTSTHVYLRSGVKMEVGESFGESLISAFESYRNGR